MKRRTFDDSGDDSRPLAASLSQSLLPCNRCRAATPHSTLATLGAMCAKCFDAYVHERPPASRFVGENDHPKAWAESLRERERSGERLSKVQREAWRSALRRETREGDAQEAA